MPNITDHQSYLEGREYPSFDPKQEKLARALVILHDYLGIKVVVSDLDCTETSDHTIGKTGIAKLATNNPDIMFASQAIRMLFPLLKQKLGVINYTMTLQTNAVANQVIKLGYDEGVFEEVIASDKYEHHARDYKGRLLFDASGDNLIKLSSDKKKQYKVLEISNKLDIPLNLFAFLSDADVDLTAYMKSQGAFVFGGDGTDNELVEVKIFGTKPNQFAAKKFNGAVTKADGSQVEDVVFDKSNQAWIKLDGKEVMGLTTARLQNMGRKLINEIEGKGIRIPDEVYNALAPIFGVPPRKAPIPLPAVELPLPFENSEEGVYATAGERPGFSADGRSAGALSKTEADAELPPVPAAKPDLAVRDAASEAPKSQESKANTADSASSKNAIEALLASIGDAEEQGNLKISREASNGSATINFLTTFNVKFDEKDFFVSSLKFQKGTSQQVNSVGINYQNASGNTESVTINLADLKSTNLSTELAEGRSIFEAISKVDFLLVGDTEQSGGLTGEFADFEEKFGFLDGSGSVKGAFPEKQPEMPARAEEFELEEDPYALYSKPNKKGAGRGGQSMGEESTKKLPRPAYPLPEDFSAADAGPEENKVVTFTLELTHEELEVRKRIGSGATVSSFSGESRRSSFDVGGDATEVPLGFEDDILPAEPAPNAAKSAAKLLPQAPLLDQLKALLVPTLPSDNEDDGSKLVSSRNPKEGFFSVFGGGTVNENRFVFNQLLTIGVIDDKRNAEVFVAAGKKSPIQYKFNVRAALGKNSENNIIEISELSFAQVGDVLTAVTIKTSRPKATATYNVDMAADVEIAKMVQEIVSQLENKLGITKPKAEAAAVDETVLLVTGGGADGISTHSGNSNAAALYENAKPAVVGNSEFPDLVGDGKTKTNQVYRGSIVDQRYEGYDRDAKYDVNPTTQGDGQLRFVDRRMAWPEAEAGDGDESEEDNVSLNFSLFFTPEQTNPAQRLIAIASQLRDYCQVLNGGGAVCRNGAVDTLPPENIDQSCDIGITASGKPKYEVGSLQQDGVYYHTVTVLSPDGRPIGTRFEIPFSGDFILTKTEKVNAEYSFSDKSHQKVGANDERNLGILEDILEVLTQDRRVGIGESGTDAPAPIAGDPSHSPLDLAAAAARNGGSSRGSSNASPSLERNPKVGKTFFVTNKDGTVMESTNL